MKSEFDIDKKNILSKKDKSKKGSIDKPIINIINFLNSLKDFYTTSSCSGRILILKIPKDGRKDHVKWLMTSHQIIEPKKSGEFIKIIKKEDEKEPEGEIWFKQEPLIIHCAARTIEKAQELLDTAKLCGFKKSGIIASKRRFVVEIEGTDFMSTIVSKDGMLYINEDYMKTLIETANRKLKRNLDKKDRFEESLKKVFKE